MLRSFKQRNIYELLVQVSKETLIGNSAQLSDHQRQHCSDLK